MSVDIKEPPQGSFASLVAAADRFFGFVKWVGALFKVQGSCGANKQTCVDEAHPVECFAIESLSYELHQPQLCCLTFPSPKRFHITFWRSLTRRMVAHSRKST
jgi:hypothetical protein